MFNGDIRAGARGAKAAQKRLSAMVFAGEARAMLLLLMLLLLLLLVLTEPLSQDGGEDPQQGPQRRSRTAPVSWGSSRFNPAARAALGERGGGGSRGGLGGDNPSLVRPSRRPDSQQKKAKAREAGAGGEEEDGGGKPKAATAMVVRHTARSAAISDRMKQISSFRKAATADAMQAPAVAEPSLGGFASLPSQQAAQEGEAERRTEQKRQALLRDPAALSATTLTSPTAEHPSKTLAHGKWIDGMFRRDSPPSSPTHSPPGDEMAGRMLKAGEGLAQDPQAQLLAMEAALDGLLSGVESAPHDDEVERVMRQITPRSRSTPPSPTTQAYSSSASRSGAKEFGGVSLVPARSDADGAALAAAAEPAKYSPESRPNPSLAEREAQLERALSRGRGGSGITRDAAIRDAASAYGRRLGAAPQPERERSAPLEKPSVLAGNSVNFSNRFAGGGGLEALDPLQGLLCTVGSVGGERRCYS